MVSRPYGVVDTTSQFIYGVLMFVLAHTTLMVVAPKAT